MRIGLIGVGSIGQHLLAEFARGAAGPVRIVVIADRPSKRERLERLGAKYSCAFTTDPLTVVDHSLDLVVEAASPQVVRECAAEVLSRRVDIVVMSVGALADDEFVKSLTVAADGRSRVHVPSGAIGGLDLVRAAAVGELEEVSLTTRKAPAALAGAPFFAERAIDAVGINETTVLFDGSAAEAVRLFPENVNVAAALSLAGIGFQRTRVRIVAEPALRLNVHEIFVRGSFGEARVTVTNVPSPQNPKTSLLAAQSAVATVRRLTSAVVF